MTSTKLSLLCLFYLSLIGAAVVSVSAQDTNSPAVQVTAASDSGASSAEIAPGIFLPPKGMIWILDQPETKPQISRIYLNRVHVKAHRAENVVRAQFLVLKMSSAIDLPGGSAQLRFTSHAPAMFIRKSQEEEEEAQSASNGKNVREHYALLRLQVTGNSRVLCTFTAREFGLKQNRQDMVEVSTQEFIPGEWIKITPKQPLPDGEYAIVHLPDDKRYFESNAYDFGIGPAIAQTKNK